jgi:hypothetical protein
MPRERISFDTVRRIGLALPNVEEGTAYGSPALKMRGNLMAVIPTNKAAEPDSVAIRVPPDQLTLLLEEQPEIYYLKPHYEGYDVVLVRMKRIPADALRDLIRMSWEFISKKPRARPRKRAAASPRSRR